MYDIIYIRFYILAITNISLQIWFDDLLNQKKHRTSNQAWTKFPQAHYFFATFPLPPLSLGQLFCKIRPELPHQQAERYGNCTNTHVNLQPC